MLIIASSSNVNISFLFYFFWREGVIRFGPIQVKWEKWWGNDCHGCGSWCDVAVVMLLFYHWCTVVGNKILIFEDFLVVKIWYSKSYGKLRKYVFFFFYLARVDTSPIEKLKTLFYTQCNESRRILILISYWYVIDKLTYIDYWFSRFVTVTNWEKKF